MPEIIHAHMLSCWYKTRLTTEENVYTVACHGERDLPSPADAGQIGAGFPLSLLPPEHILPESQFVGFDGITWFRRKGSGIVGSRIPASLGRSTTTTPIDTAPKTPNLGKGFHCSPQSVPLWKDNQTSPPSIESIRHTSTHTHTHTHTPTSVRVCDR